jgi:hypothetical protein
MAKPKGKKQPTLVGGGYVTKPALPKKRKKKGKGRGGR